MGDLFDEICTVLNRYSRENASNTPDFILAEYLRQSLETFEGTVRARDEWYGIQPSPGNSDG